MRCAATVTALVLAGLPWAGEARAQQDWGTIKGRIVWDGDQPPAQKAVEVTKDHEHCLAKGPIPDESVVVNKTNGGMRWVFVWLIPDQPGAKLPINPKLKNLQKKQEVMDQPCCRFEPHALALRQGTVLIAKNSAPIAHNVNYTGGLKNPGNNVLVPPGSEIKVENLKADKFPIQVACNIHPWMKAWVRVFDHPYFAVTEADGSFEIKDAPAGNVRLMIWQDLGYSGGAKGRNGTPITIKAGQTTDLGKIKFEPPPQ